MCIKNNRVVWVDNAKAIAILLVIVGHMGFPEEVRSVIYGCHMPLFFILSGLFLSTNDSFAVFVYKKAKTLLIPYCCFNIIMILFEYMLNFIMGGSINC